MLHVGICPHHDRWADVLANLAAIIVDEAHVYRGVFGAHVANVLRRLRRACALAGSAPQFLLASATIANPVEAMSTLTGVVEVVIARTARRSPRARSRSGTRRCSTPTSASGRRRWPRPPR